MWIPIEQSVMVSDTVYVFMGFAVRSVIGHVQLSLLGGGATGALTTISGLIIFLILLKID